MPFALDRVVKLEDFEEPIVREAIREVFAREAAESSDFPHGQEHRKLWEVAMGVLALREGGVLRPDAEVLGIGANDLASRSAAAIPLMYAAGLLPFLVALGVLLQGGIRLGFPRFGMTAVRPLATAAGERP